MRITAFMLLTFCAAIFATSGCAFLNGEPQMSQAQIKQLESRTIDAPFKEVYDASIEALFDLGYTIVHTDKESGVIMGERSSKSYRTVWVTLADGNRSPSSEEYLQTKQLTILVKPEGRKQCTVRIKSSRNKESSFDKKAINEVWLYIDRQVLMEGGPTK